MTSTNNRARRLAAAGALAVAAVAAPVAASVLVTTAPDVQVAQGGCLAWFGNKEDGQCLGRSSGNGVNVGTPSFGFYGPDGAGFSTGPLLPGTTISEGIN